MTCNVTKVTYNMYSCDTSYMSREMMEMDGRDSAKCRKSKLMDTLQEIHSLPTKITDRLNSVGNYRRNIDGTKHIIFSTFLLPFTDRIPTENY